MGILSENIEVLISKQLSGQATSLEKEELERWIKSDHQNQKVYQDTEKAWKHSTYSFSDIQKKEDWEKIRQKIVHESAKTSSRKILLQKIYRAAAVITIPILLGIGWYFGKASSAVKLEGQGIFTAPAGQRAYCELADGSRIWLNSESTLYYSFPGKGERREVRLVGEAYFNVAKDTKHPFIVKTDDADVKVTGTSFNVKAYPDLNTMETTLEEGSVELKLICSAKKETIQLKPGEHAVYYRQEKKMVINKMDTYLLTAWRDGKYIFKDADLETITIHLEKLYSVHIHLSNDSLKHLRFRGMFEYNKNIFDALETLERTTNLKYKMNGRDIWIEQDTY